MSATTGFLAWKQIYQNKFALCSICGFQTLLLIEPNYDNKFNHRHIIDHIAITISSICPRRWVQSLTCFVKYHGPRISFNWIDFRYSLSPIRKLNYVTACKLHYVLPICVELYTDRLSNVTARGCVSHISDNGDRIRLVISLICYWKRKSLCNVESDVDCSYVDDSDGSCVCYCWKAPKGVAVLFYR